MDASLTPQQEKGKSKRKEKRKRKPPIPSPFTSCLSLTIVLLFIFLFLSIRGTPLPRIDLTPIRVVQATDMPSTTPVPTTATPAITSGATPTWLVGSTVLTVNSPKLPGRIAFLSRQVPGNNPSYINSASFTQGDLYVMNADGSEPVQLTHTGHEPVPCDWSADDQHISFLEMQPYDGVAEVKVSDPTQITSLGQVNLMETATWNLIPTGCLWERRLSPDGKHLLIEEHNILYLADADGSHRMTLTTPPAAHSLAWSPDGKFIAFIALSTDGSGLFLYMMRADGSNLVHLTSEGYSDYPSWSPDSRYIAFSCRQIMRVPFDNFQICVISVDGSFKAQLTTVGENMFPIWSHD